jgi:HSP20 family protein
MTFLVRNSALNDFRNLQSRLLEPFFGRFNYMDDTTASGTWSPAVDVAEDADRIHVKVEVPGMEEKDLKISFEDGLLTVSGERQFERRDDRNYHRIERAYGSFFRTFSLPRSVNSAEIVANYRNGVLEIEIPKKEESKPRQIQINNQARQIEK